MDINVRAIRNDQDHQAALTEIEALWNAPEGSDDAAKLDALVTLVDRYETARWPMDDPDRDPIDVLHYAIEEGGHSQAELAEILGSRSRASEVLSRRRALTVEMIHKISEAWKLPPSLLVRPYPTSRVVRRRSGARQASVPRTRNRASRT
jgi:antitoxin component HigA of HigAB toxin-antitoxin module